MSVDRCRQAATRHWCVSSPSEGAGQTGGWGSSGAPAVASPDCHGHRPPTPAQSSGSGSSSSGCRSASSRSAGSVHQCCSGHSETT